MKTLLALTGTPGTGKTTVAKLLQKETGANIISLKALVESKKVNSTWDRLRKINIVDARTVRAAVRKEAKPGLNLVDGHLSHLTGAKNIVVLRCRPDVLRKRMQKRGWTKNKINENLQAEILDVITLEALQQKKKVIIEIDTTKLTPKKTALLLKKLLANRALQKKYAAGKLDWTRKFSHYLIDYPVEGKK